MALFDGGRWDRVRNFRAAGAWFFRGLRVQAEVNMHELMLPKFRCGVEDGTAWLEIGLGGAWNDRFVSTSLSMPVADRVCDAFGWDKRRAPG